MTLHLHFTPDGSPQAFKAGLDRVQSQTGIKAILVFACDANGWTAEAIDPIAATANLPVVGGIYPGVIHGGQRHYHGTLLVGLPMDVDIGVVDNLSDPDKGVELPLDALAAGAARGEPTTHLVFVDGLASGIRSLVEGLFMSFGIENHFIGGGAGSLSFIQRPCLLTPDGLQADVALIITLATASAIGVTHGWAPVSDSMVVTSSERNMIKSLDWQPAAAQYARMIEADGGGPIDPDDFFATACSYPLGMVRLNAEMVVRDPLMSTPEGALVCVGEVPEGCTVRLLNGNHDTLIAAADQARQQALSQAAEQRLPAPLNDWILIDCISRALYLGDDFAAELDAVGQGGRVFGALTLGEIANSGDDYLEFFNKTTVLGILGGKEAS